MAENIVALRLLFSLTMAAGLLATALFLAVVPPVRTPKRLLAVLLALMGFRELAAFDLLTRGSLPGTVWTMWNYYFTDLTIVISVVVGAFFWVYPTRIRARSWHGLAVGGALTVFLSAALLWAFDRHLLLVGGSSDLAAGQQFNFPGRLLLGEGAAVALLAVVASALLRAARLEGSARAGAVPLCAMTTAATFTIPGYYIFAGLSRLAGLRAVDPAWLRPLPGDCCHVDLALGVLGILGALVLAGALAVRDRIRLPLYLVVFGFVIQFPLLASPVDLYPMNYVFAAFAPLYAVIRHGAMDTPRVRARASYVTAAVVMVIVFLAVSTLASLIVAESSLGLAVGIFAGLLIAVAAAWAVLPRSQALLSSLGLDPGEGETGRRLDAYRAALQAEIEGGSGGPTLSTKLRALRAQLGVSEREHALMEYTLRGVLMPAVRAQALQPGDAFLGRYRVKRLLGRGGAGSTYLCRDERVARDVVLKALRSASPTPEGLEAVLREARALASVRHPHVVTLHDVEQIGDEAFIVMEYLEGGSLAARLEAGPLPAQEFADLARGLLGALEAVHGAGVVHRDVKPSNVLLTGDGRAKLGDFGVAHLPGFETTAGPMSQGLDAVGTVRYMSPEQARGHQALPRSDLYAAGLTLFEALRGEPYLRPAAGESAIEVQMRAAAAGAFAAERIPPGPLRAWFSRALAPAPEQRFGAAGEMLRALEGALAAEREETARVTPAQSTAATGPPPPRRLPSADERRPWGEFSN